MKPLSRLLVALCLCPLLAEAAPLHQITLPDGRQVQLNDDFTWEYLLVKPAATVAGQAVTASVAAPVLTEQAMAHPDLLSQATRDGITVKLDQVAGDDPQKTFCDKNAIPVDAASRFFKEFERIL